MANSGAKLDNYGVPVEIKNEGSSVGEFSDATYNYLRIQMGDYYGRYLRIVANGLDCGGSSYHKWAVTEVSEGNFVFRCIYQSTQVAYATQGYYVAVGSNDELVLVDGIDNAAVWQFVNADTQKNIVASAADARLAAIASNAGITANSVSELEAALASMDSADKTSDIVNPTMYENTEGWTVNNIQGTSISNGSYQIQNAAGGQSMTTQTVTGLAPGIYKATVQSFYRASVLDRCVTFGNAGYKFTNAYFKANDNEVLIKDWYEISTDDHTKPVSRGNIKDEFNEGEKYTNTVYTYVGDDGILNLTIAVPSFSAGDYPNWICYNNVTLTYYYSAEDLSAYEAQLAAVVSTANGISPLPAKATEDLLAVVTEYNKTYSTADAYTTAINAIKDATDKAKDVSKAYADYIALKAKMEAIRDQNVYTDPEGAVATFNNACSTADDAIQVAALNEAEEVVLAQMPNIRAAVTSLLSGVKINEGAQFDLTSLLVNPQLAPKNSTTAEGWTTTANLDYGSYQITQFNSSTPFDLHQTLEAMPAGIYELKVRGFYRPGAFNADDMNTVASTEVPTMIYLNDTQQALLNICADGSPTQLSKGASTVVNGNTIYIPNSRSHLQAFYDEGYYWNNMEAVVGTNGNITIGLKYDSWVSGGWGVISDFNLYYRGALDLSEYETQLAAAVNAANQLVLLSLIHI